jgi:hypothetical protein
MTPVIEPRLSQIASDVRYRLIPGYPGYRAGTDGSIWSCWKFSGARINEPGTWSQTPCWHQLKPDPSRRRFRFRLRVGPNQYKKRFGHVLVLETFVGPCPPGLECCHGDGNEGNNRLDNLRWDTRQSNIQDKRKHGTLLLGSSHGNAKLTELDVLDIRTRHAAGEPPRRIHRDYPAIKRSYLCSLCSGCGWAHVAAAPRISR